MYYSNLITSTLVTVFLFTSAAASADSIHVKREHKYQDKIYGYSQAWLDENGKGKLYSHYSNCSWDGDTLSTVAVLVGKNGEKLGAVEIRAGMNPYIKGCNEREIDKHFSMTPGMAKQVATIRLEHRTIDTVNDRLVFSGLIKIIEAILGGPSEPEKNGVHWKS